MKRIKATFTIPKAVNEEAPVQELDALKLAYIEAENDQARKQVILEWESLGVGDW